MASTLRTFLPVVGDEAALAAAFEGDPVRWLPEARREGPRDITLTVRAGTLSRVVTASIGRPWRAGRTRWRALTWDPVVVEGEAVPLERMLPSLDGELGLHVESQRRATLVLDARYRPPGGILGRGLDAVALGRVATATGERFLAEVAGRLSAEALLFDAGSASGDPPGQDRPAPVGA